MKKTITTFALAITVLAGIAQTKQVTPPQPEIYTVKFTLQQLNQINYSVSKADSALTNAHNSIPIRDLLFQLQNASSKKK